MRTHVTILGWLQILAGLIDLLLALVLFGLLAGVGLLGTLGGAVPAGILSGAMAIGVGIAVALTALPNLLAGWGLLNHRGWGRILALIMAAINAFKFPWGTALAVYTFWALTDPDAEALFR